MPTIQKNENPNHDPTQSVSTTVQRKITVEEVEDEFWATMLPHTNLAGELCSPSREVPRDSVSENQALTSDSNVTSPNGEPKEHWSAV
jgi:hypothetical protein